jgi:hypothetical protein
LSRLNGEHYVATTFLRFLVRAWHYRHVPFFLCLDEMNLAPVEHYFAEYLSVIETRTSRDGGVTTDDLISRHSFTAPRVYDALLESLGVANKKEFVSGISIPPNLVVVGTVNMDETTHSFSRKVLDRAMTIERNVVNFRAGLDGSSGDWSFPKEFVAFNDVVGAFTSGSEVVKLYEESEKVLEHLQKINDALEDTPFKIAYRTRDEFLIYCYYAGLFVDRPDDWLERSLDEMTLMKVLSRIEGDESKTGRVFTSFLNNVLAGRFPKTTSKLREMQKRLEISGYTSFWS